MTWKLKGIKYLKQERGSILVLVVLLLPIMFGCLGFAYDFGNLYMHRTRLQNVADAAALAGARAYLDSQTTDNPDGIDGTIDRTNGKVTGGEGTTSDKTGRQEYTYVPTSNPNPSSITHGDSKHSKADNAADAYIFKNIINLGTEVKSDKWSHYAINSDGASPKTFYRIGLSEDVRLYFLPIIKNVPKTQKIRVGAVVLVEPGTTETISGSGDSTTVSYSIFDNLFTYSDEFHSVTASDNTEAREAFIGDIVYTHGNSNHTVYYTYSDVGLVQHLYESGGSFEGNKINDATIDTTFNTLDYLEALTTDKLKLPHVSLLNINNDPQTIKASDINNENSSIYLSEIFGPNGEQVWKGRTNGTPYIYQDGEYYMVDGNTGAYTYVNEKKASYCKYSDQNLKQLLPCVKDGDKYYVLNKDNTESDFYLQNFNGNSVISRGNCLYNIYRNGKYYNRDSNGNYYTYENGNCYQVNESGDYINGQRIAYTPVDNGLQTVITNLKDPINDDFSNQQDQDKYKAKILSNIIYTTHNMNIEIDTEVIGVDNPSVPGTPIYIIADGDDLTLKLYVYTDNKRPIILVYTGHTTQLQVEKIASGATFEGVIYAPYSTGGVHLHNEEGGTFEGNIIAHKIEIQNSGRNTWRQHNYLESSDPEGYTDSDVAKATQKVMEANQNNSYDKLDQDIKNDILTTLNIPESMLGNMDAFNNLSYDEKQTFYRNWKRLYEKYKYNNAARNVLWPWNQHFNVDGNSTSITTGETMRLINFRTDFQEKKPDGTVNNDEKDPFIYLSLDGKSY